MSYDHVDWAIPVPASSCRPKLTLMVARCLSASSSLLKAAQLASILMEILKLQAIKVAHYANFLENPHVMLSEFPTPNLPFTHV